MLFGHQTECHQTDLSKFKLNVRMYTHIISPKVQQIASIFSGAGKQATSPVPSPQPIPHFQSFHGCWQ